MESLLVVDGVSRNGVAGRVSGVWGESSKSSFEPEDAFRRHKEGLEGGDTSSVDAVLLRAILGKHQDFPGGMRADSISGGADEGVALDVLLERADDAARIFSISATIVAVFRIWTTDAAVREWQDDKEGKGTAQCGIFKYLYGMESPRLKGPTSLEKNKGIDSKFRSLFFSDKASALLP